MNLQFTWIRLISFVLLLTALILSGNGQNLIEKFKSSNQMVAIVAHLACLYERLFARTLHSAISPKFYNPKLPAPPVLHRVLDDEFLSKFDDILIVGDLHGCYDEMIDLLDLAIKSSKKLNARILKLFVGDLVNKGPKSKAILDHFMKYGKEDMLAVRGNHDERIVQEYMKYIKDKNYELNIEHLWIKDLNSEHIDFLISLPYTISLPKFNSIIVHAGLVPGKHIEQNNYTDMTLIRNVIYEDYYDGDGVKGLELDNVGEPWVKAWKGNLHVYFGHDAKRGLQQTEYATGLDTGVVYGKKLTAVLIDQSNLKKQFLEVKAKRLYCDPFNRPPRQKK